MVAVCCQCGRDKLGSTELDIVTKVVVEVWTVCTDCEGVVEQWDTEAVLSTSGLLSFSSTLSMIIHSTK